MTGLGSKSSRLSPSTRKPPLPWNQVDKMQTFTFPSVAADPISQSYPKLCNRAPMQPPFPPYPILRGSHRSTPSNFVPQFQHAPLKPTQPGKQVSPCDPHLSSCLLLLLRSQSHHLLCSRTLAVVSLLPSDPIPSGSQNFFSTSLPSPSSSHSLPQSPTPAGIPFGLFHLILFKSVCLLSKDG